MTGVAQHYGHIERRKHFGIPMALSIGHTAKMHGLTGAVNRTVGEKRQTSPNLHRGRNVLEIMIEISRVHQQRVHRSSAHGIHLPQAHLPARESHAEDFLRRHVERDFRAFGTFGQTHRRGTFQTKTIFSCGQRVKLQGVAAAFRGRTGRQRQAQTLHRLLSLHHPKRGVLHVAKPQDHGYRLSGIDRCGYIDAQTGRQTGNGIVALPCEPAHGILHPLLFVEINQALQREHGVLAPILLRQRPLHRLPHHIEHVTSKDFFLMSPRHDRQPAFGGFSVEQLLIGQSLAEKRSGTLVPLHPTPFLEFVGRGRRLPLIDLSQRSPLCIQAGQSGRVDWMQMTNALQAANVTVNAVGHQFFACQTIVQKGCQRTTGTLRTHGNQRQEREQK